MRLTDILNEVNKKMDVTKLKRGDKLTINLGQGKENVEVMSNFKAGLSKFDFITLKRKAGAPYTITLSRLEKAIVNEVKNKKPDFETFHKFTQLQFTAANPRWDKDGNALVNIKLKTKAGAPFSYEYKKNAANVDDYIKDRKLKLPIQIKQTIYDKFFK